MKTLNIHVSQNSDGALWSNCTLEIPSVGEIQMRDLVSRETFDRLSLEVESNARSKMGMKYENKEAAGPARS